MSVFIFGDLLDTNEGQTFNTNERNSSMAYIKNVSHSQPKHRDVTRPYSPGPTWPLRVGQRLSYTVREAVHSPVKVNDQLGDAYKQVVNSYGVRRQVGRTLCVCEGTTYMTCVKGAQGPRIKVYANNCQTWAHHRLLVLARG